MVGVVASAKTACALALQCANRASGASFLTGAHATTPVCVAWPKLLGEGLPTPPSGRIEGLPHVDAGEETCGQPFRQCHSTSAEHRDIFLKGFFPAGIPASRSPPCWLANINLSERGFELFRRHFLKKVQPCGNSSQIDPTKIIAL